MSKGMTEFDFFSSIWATKVAEMCGAEMDMISRSLYQPGPNPTRIGWITRVGWSIGSARVALACRLYELISGKSVPSGDYCDY